MNKKHIRILGAGPSGITAAITLKNHEYNVTVYEQKEKPGDRFTDSWQILENYSTSTDALQELKSMNIASEFLCCPQSEITFYDSKLRSFPLKSSKPFGYFVKRGSGPDTLDTALHHQALNCGVEIHYATKISPEDADIVATGSKHATGISKEISFDSDNENVLLTILDNYLTPFGFSYLFIINGRGTIGTAVLRDFKYINHYANTVLLRFKQLLKFSMNNVKESVSSVGFFLPTTAVNDGKIYIGEAAGFQDYLFGFGIRRSIQSGFLAAKSIIENVQYDFLWKQHFGKNLSSGVLNRYIFEKSGNAGYSLLLKTAKHFDFQKIGFMLQNPSRIRLLLSRLIRQFWHTKTKCMHGSRCAWCRTLQ